MRGTYSAFSTSFMSPIMRLWVRLMPRWGGVGEVSAYFVAFGFRRVQAIASVTGVAGDAAIS
ncbi:hypothetical protein [Mycobacteroides salmoniphilum]|nr:hypothetical protein [Mycobacteroides salmoniphilum]